MNVTPVQKTLINIRKVAANPKFAEFARNTVCAISVETTLKATGRPAFIYYDKHANKQSKKYAATKEFIYQTFCLGLYLSFIKPLSKKVYSFVGGRLASANPENKRKLELYDKTQKMLRLRKVLKIS